MQDVFRRLLFLPLSALALETSSLAQGGLHGAPPAAPGGLRPARGEVVVVDANGNGAFTQIQDAIDWARNGDFVLVRAGTYSSFTLTDRTLTITADQGASVHVLGGCKVEGLAPNTRVLLAGLDLDASTSYPQGFLEGVSAPNYQGALRVERCTLSGYDYFWYQNGGPGLFAQSCADLVVSDCTLYGGTATGVPSFGWDGGDGLNCVDSTIATYGSSFYGAVGGWGQDVGGTGGNGARFSGGQAFASACLFSAGEGGSSLGNCTGQGGDAGQPVFQPTGVVVSALDCLIEGAVGGNINQGCGYPGNSSNPLGGTGPYSTLSGSARSLAANLNPIREGQTLVLTVTGQPGDVVFVVFALQGAHQFNANLHGVVLTGQPYLLNPMIGTIPASGTLTYALPIGRGSAPPIGAVRWYLQAAMQTAAGAVFLTNPVDLVVLHGGV